MLGGSKSQDFDIYLPKVRVQRILALSCRPLRTLSSPYMCYLCGQCNQLISVSSRNPHFRLLLSARVNVRAPMTESSFSPPTKTGWTVPNSTPSIGLAAVYNDVTALPDQTNIINVNLARLGLPVASRQFVYSTRTMIVWAERLL